MANREIWAKPESPTPMEDVDDAATEEKEDQKYPVMKLTNIGDDAWEIVNRLAGVTIVSLSDEESPSPVRADTTVGQPTGTLPTGKAMSSGAAFLEREDEPKRKAATKVYKIAVPVKKPKGETATAGQPAGSELGERGGEPSELAQAALTQIEGKMSQLHLV